MRLQVQIDICEAIRLGLNAPAKTASMDLEPQMLTQDERDVLSAYVTIETPPLLLGFRLPAPTLEFLKKALATKVKESIEKRAAKQERENEATAHAMAAIEVGPTAFAKHQYPHPDNYTRDHYQDYRAAFDAVPGISELRQKAERLKEEAKRAAEAELARAEELLAPTINNLKQQCENLDQRLKEAKADAKTLANFLSWVPEDAKRGALKAMAEKKSASTMAELADHIEAASPAGIDIFEAAEAEYEDDDSDE